MRPAAHRIAPLAQTGFTLIEILVVVVIIGIVTAGALLSLGNAGKDTQLERERDRIAALMTYVHERGEMLTLEYGIRCGLHGYTFSVYDSRQMQWLPDTSDETLRPRKLPPGLKLQLVIEGRPVVLDDKTLNAPPLNASATLGGSDGSGDSGQQVVDYTPQIQLFSNGDTNSFALTLSREGVNRSATVQSGDDGEIHVGDVIEAPR